MTSPFIQQIADNRVCQVLTCLPEKFVVDFANGIDVAQEHIRTAGERTFFRRLKEGLTGEGAARQNAINASLAQGVEASPALADGDDNVTCHHKLRDYPGKRQGQFTGQ